MKMLQAGSKMSAVWSDKFECTGHGNGGNGCGAVLEVSGDDLYHTYKSFMGRYETWYATFMCPGCGEQTDIYNTDGYKHPNYRTDLFQVKELPHGRPHLVRQARALLKAGQYVPPHKIRGAS